MGIFIIAIAAAVLFIVITKLNTDEKIDSNRKASEDFESDLISTGFCIDKKVESHATSAALLIDSSKCEWTVRTYANKYRRFKYDELSAFELIENNAAVSTATLEAMLSPKNSASATDKVSASTCELMEIHIRVEDLQTPNVVIPLVVAPILRNSDYYKSIFAIAQEMLASLTYISTHRSDASKEIHNA